MKNTESLMIKIFLRTKNLFGKAYILRCYIMGLKINPGTAYAAPGFEYYLDMALSYFPTLARMMNRTRIVRTMPTGREINTDCVNPATM